MGRKAYSSRANRALLRGRGIKDPSAYYWRAIATRYDKLALIYRALVVLCTVVVWLRQ